MPLLAISQAVGAPLEGNFFVDTRSSKCQSGVLNNGILEAEFSKTNQEWQERGACLSERKNRISKKKIAKFIVKNEFVFWSYFSQLFVDTFANVSCYLGLGCELESYETV